MVLNMNYTRSIVIVILLGIPALLLIKSSLYSRQRETFLNRFNIESIKGACLVMILVNQLIERLSHVDQVLQGFELLGMGEVGIYLFLTGIELQKRSVNSNGKISKKFLQSSIRLFLMFLIANLVLGIVLIYLGEDLSIIKPIHSTLIGEFVDGKKAILIYPLIIFNFLFGITKKIGVMSCLGLLLGWPGVLINLGIWTMSYSKIIFFLLNKHLLKLCFISILLLPFSLKYHSLISLIGIMMIMIILIKVKFNSPFFRLINRFSITVYLLQVPIMYLVFYSSESKSSIFLLLSMGISLILAILLKLLFMKDLRQLR